MTLKRKPVTLPCHDPGCCHNPLMDSIDLVLKATSLAAIQHGEQRRKNFNKTPYINHPIKVASILNQIAGIRDAEVLAAAILHDTVEDTDLSLNDIRVLLGERVAAWVAECTDDKTQPKAERKRHQILSAPTKSPQAKLIKLADKIANVWDIPNVDWPTERKRDYLDWALQVVSGLRGVNAALDDEFDRVLNVSKRIVEAMADPKYILVAKAFIYDNQGRCLFIKRSSNSKHCPGQWEIPGGKVDPTEGIDQALVREIQEETGLKVFDARVLSVDQSDDEPTKYLFVILEAQAAATHVTLSPEHEQHIWATPTEAVKLDLAPAYIESVRKLAERSAAGRKCQI